MGRCVPDPNIYGSKRKELSVFEIGKKVFVRTITNYLVGQIDAKEDGFIELIDAAWVADTGRFSDFIKNGTAREVEPVDRVIVSLSAIIDAYPWPHKLPLERL